MIPFVVFRSAAGFGKTDVVRWLLDHGADVNMVGRGKTSGTALARAARFGHAECVAALLAGGAAWDVPDGDGVTAAGHALAFDHLPVVRAMLAAACGTPSPLSIVETLQPFLGAGATALHVCAQWGSVRCLAHLLHGTADNVVPRPSRAVVDTATSDGTTALHLAARWGHVAAVQLLLGAGAARGRRDAAGHTAAALARKWGRTTCASLLDAGD
jgi:hypothetical protein